MTVGHVGVLALLGVLVVGRGCGAKPADRVGVVVPKDGSSCGQIRDKLERTLYDTFKGSVERSTLKEVLPLLIPSLLPPRCLPSPSSSPAHLSRPKRFLPGFFMPPAPRKLKDPGDHPPPGMASNPFKDIGDRPGGILSLFGFRPPRKIKDPGDRPPPPPPGEAPAPGEGPAPASPMSSMMSMMRMLNFGRQMARLFAPRQAAGPPPPPAEGKIPTGGLYGDVLPAGR